MIKNTDDMEDIIKLLIDLLDNVNIKYEKYIKFFKENYMTKRKIKIVQPSLLMDY
jgi:hypothetical protein